MKNKRLFASLLVIITIIFISITIMYFVGYYGVLIFTFTGPLVFQLIVKKRIMVLSISFIIYTIIAIFMLYSAWGMLEGAFGASLIYTSIPTIISLIGILVADLISMCIKRFIK